MIKFETISGETVEIRGADEQDSFELAVQSKDPNAFFYVGNVRYFVRGVIKDHGKHGTGYPLEKKKLY